MNFRSYKKEDKDRLVEIFHSNCPKYFNENDINDFIDFLNNYADKNYLVVIENNKKKNEIKNIYMSKNKNRTKDKSVFENVYFQINQKDLVAIEKFNSNNNVAVNLNFIEIDNGMLSRRIDSKKAIWEETNSKWNLKDFSIREFEKDGLEKNVIISKIDSLVALKFEPHDIIKTASKSEEVSYSELKKQIILTPPGASQGLLEAYFCMRNTLRRSLGVGEKMHGLAKNLYILTPSVGFSSSWCMFSNILAMFAIFCEQNMLSRPSWAVPGSPGTLFLQAEHPPKIPGGWRKKKNENFPIDLFRLILGR